MLRPRLVEYNRIIAVNRYNIITFLRPYNAIILPVHRSFGHDRMCNMIAILALGFFLNPGFFCDNLEFTSLQIGDYVGKLLLSGDYIGK